MSPISIRGKRVNFFFGIAVDRFLLFSSYHELSPSFSLTLPAFQEYAVGPNYILFLYLDM